MNPEPSEETKQALAAAGRYLSSVLFGGGIASRPRCLGCGRIVAAENTTRIHDNGICAKRYELRLRMKEAK